MEYQSSYDGWLEDLPFPIPPGLYGSVLVSPNITEILANAEQFMGFKEYQTAAALFTIALQRLGNPDQFPQKVADLLCKRAECLLLMNYVQNVLRDCQTARRMIGRVTEYVAFLLLRAFEMQGEVEEAFGHAVIYRALDPQMKRDKHAVRRLRQIVGWLCGQGYHQIYRTVDILMLRGEILFSNKETDLALKIYTEVLNLFPDVLEAYEMRAQCYLIGGYLRQANQDCNRALRLSERSSRVAFDTKIQIMVLSDELKEALELLDEWRMIDPENLAINSIEMNVKSKMRERQAGRAVSKSQSLSDLSVADNELCDPDELQTKKRVKRPPIRASKQCSDAKPKSKSELMREEWRREKERKEIAQELEKQREKENRIKKESVDAIKREAQSATNQKTVGNVT